MEQLAQETIKAASEAITTAEYLAEYGMIALGITVFIALITFMLPEPG